MRTAVRPREFAGIDGQYGGSCSAQRGQDLITVDCSHSFPVVIDASLESGAWPDRRGVFRGCGGMRSRGSPWHWRCSKVWGPAVNRKDYRNRYCRNRIVPE